MIPYGRQNITEDDINEVEKVLRSDFLTQGPLVPKFEQSIASYCSASYSVAVNSATSALHIACMALNLGPGDWLWTSPNTFVASANCALHCGAKVDFVDIDPYTYNLSVDKLSIKLEKAEKLGKLPKIVIPVHYAGQSCDMSVIHKLSKKYGFKIIEDASHALGGSYKNSKIGSCTFSDITVFSFHPVKIITTAEGGMALTNNKEIADKIRRLRTHGITNDKKIMSQRSSDEIWNYQQIELGFNYRMNDIQAALGLSQMKKLDDYVKLRHEIAKVYDDELKSLTIKLPFQASETYSSYHLYPISILNLEKNNQKQIYLKLKESDIGVNMHYIPIHRHPYYESLGFKKNDFPQAEKFHREAISISIYPFLLKKNQDYIIEKLKKLLI
tara:strand:- start:81 stop:1238 length:1158 start_codon:yes stop_codon:yes gene_type:complete